MTDGTFHFADLDEQDCVDVGQLDERHRVRHLSFDVVWTPFKIKTQGPSCQTFNRVVCLVAICDVEQLSAQALRSPRVGGPDRLLGFLSIRLGGDC